MTKNSQSKRKYRTYEEKVDEVRNGMIKRLMKNPLRVECHPCWWKDALAPLVFICGLPILFLIYGSLFYAITILGNFAVAAIYKIFEFIF